MLRRVTVLQRKPGIEPRHARDHWLGAHGELVRAVPGVVAYEQRVASPTPFPSTPDVLGIGEVSFVDAETVEAALASAEWDAVIADAAAFAVLPPIAVTWIKD